MESNFAVKRIYSEAQPDDGKRVLIDRLWPRGVKKSEANVDVWLKDVSPSSELRTAFMHDPARFDEFRLAYEHELTTMPERVAAVQNLLEWAEQGPVTLLYAARDPVYNHAVVLQQFLRERLQAAGK